MENGVHPREKLTACIIDKQSKGCFTSLTNYNNEETTPMILKETAREKESQQKK